MKLCKYLKRLENNKIREERNRFSEFMKSNGWKMYILFMRGTKWIKGDDEIIIDMNGVRWNKETITRDEMEKRLGYK